MLDLQTILFAFFGGLLPAILWLFFWLREDKEKPEPAKRIALTFVYGMLAVPIALIIQLAVNTLLLGYFGIEEAVSIMPITAIVAIIILATSEEITKYFAAWHGGMKKDDEPIDDVIYMITAALGFAALENTLFLFGPLLQGNTELAIVTGNMRFVGATLLHVGAAAIIGMFRGFSHFKLKQIKKRYVWSGFILAIALHAGFNLFIIKNANAVLLAFTAVWVLILIILFLFEKLKSVHVEPIEK